MAEKRSGSNRTARERQTVQRNRRSRRLSRRNRTRLLIVFFVVLVCFAGLVVRLVQLNVTNKDTYDKYVLSLLNYDGTTIPYKRGDITDRNKTVLATSEKIYSLILDPYVVNNSTNANSAVYVEQVLNEYFGYDEDEIEEILEEHPDSRYVVLKSRLSYDDISDYNEFLESEDPDDAVVAAAVSDGIWFEESYQRVYPFSTLACDLIGFTASDNTGLWGLENYYDDELSGINGRNYGYLDEDVDLQTVTEEPVNGNTIVSTIDVNIQRIAEKYIDEFMEETGAKNIAAIVMDPNNGEILAMASAPEFDLNNPRDLTVCGYTEEDLEEMTTQEMSDALNQIWRNFCVNDAYEPGSTAKTLTVAYALDQGLVSYEDTFYCDGGQSYSDGTYISCNAVHGVVTLEEALTKSCNDALMQIGDKIGVSSFVDMQKMFGLGQLTGIDLPGEASCSGSIFNEETMGPAELWTSAFGQGYNATMVQIASAFCSIINGGYYYEPHVVSEIISDAGNTVKVYGSTLMRRTVSEQTSEWMRSTLYETVESGTGTAAQVEGYKIGGKTGTAEKLPRGTNARLVSFIGAAPIDDPQVVVYVVVDEPDVYDQGHSSFASGIASNIFSEVLPYMQIFPEYDEPSEEEITEEEVPAE